MQNKASISERFEMLRKIVSGLSCIHKNGLKHMDIKLSNIMINLDKRDPHVIKWDGHSLVIIDFGIGGKSSCDSNLSGTPGFASPEQLISPESIPFSYRSFTTKNGKNDGTAMERCLEHGNENILSIPGQESDLYSLGRLMVYIFSEWKSAWSLLYTPVDRTTDLQGFNDGHILLIQVIRQLLHVCYFSPSDPGLKYI